MENDKEKQPDNKGIDSRHWVEDLFKPTYNYSKDELLKKASPPRRGLTDEFVSPEDVTHIKNVYERVFLMLQMDEELKKTEEQRKKEDEKRTKDEADARKYRVINVEDETLWDEDELGILREMYRNTQRENRQLNALVKVQDEELTTLRKAVKETGSLYEKKNDKLRDAEVANERLRIMSETLKTQFKGLHMKNRDLALEIKELKMNRVDLIDGFQKMKLRNEKDGYEIKKLGLDLQQHRQKAALDMQIREDEVRNECEAMQIKLQERIDFLEKELEKEKEAHKISKRGLDQLRMHFASLPNHGQINLKKRDHLKTLDM